MNVSYSEYILKSKKNTPQVFFDYLYRKISHPPSFLFIRFGLTPNVVSFLSFLLMVFGGVLVCFGRPVGGILMFMCSYLLDFCDGNVARIFINTIGLDRIYQKKGALIENFNTNISLLVMYGSFGYFLAVESDNILFLLFAFLVFGVKMVARYGVSQEYSAFKDFFSSKSKNDQPLIEYKKSLKNKIKFFLRKAFFSANFYYPLYLAVFLFFDWFCVYAFFIFYAGFDLLYNVMRLLVLFFRKYKTN